MNQLRNRVQLIGRLGNDPEVKTLESGKSLASFRIATSEVYYKDGERMEETQWHQAVAWGQKAELVSKYLKKGEEVALEGKLVHRSYENGKGEKRYVSEVNVTELMFISSKKDNAPAKKNKKVA